MSNRLYSIVGLILTILLVVTASAFSQKVELSKDDSPKIATNVHDLDKPVINGQVPVGWEVLPTTDIITREGPFTVDKGVSVGFQVNGFVLMPVRDATGQMRGVYIEEPQAPAKPTTYGDLTLPGVIRKEVKSISEMESSLSEIALALEELNTVKGAEQPETPVEVKKADVIPTPSQQTNTVVIPKKKKKN